LIRALYWILPCLLSGGVARGQDNAKRFDDASLTKQQQADILRVTGDQSDEDDIPGKPFIEFLRLAAGSKKPPQIVAWRGDGAMGNKDIWIFQQNASRAVLILGGTGGSMYSRLRSVHHGMRDFITFWNLGGGTGENEVFEFDGKRYRSAYCYDTSLGSDTEPEKDGPHHPCNSK
jgi:hypothetical protein